LYLRGTAPAIAGQQPELTDVNSVSLDGEPIAPAGGFLSGDGNPGGDFTAAFTVFNIG
jgi:hypothetical protein